jgi:hypothetical protein
VALFFGPDARRYALNLIAVYSHEVTSRVLAAFANIAAEADARSDDYFDNKMDEPAWDDTGPDEAEIAEAADDHGVTFYSDLQFVKHQVTGLAISGLYHLWERVLKQFLERESGKSIASADFHNLIELLTSCGWKTLRSTNFYNDLEHLRLIANVIKHGDGTSCDELLATSPEMFREGIYSSYNRIRKAEHLELASEDFLRFTVAVREFFEQFPEEINYQSGASRVV